MAGESLNPAAWCALEIEVRRRVMVPDANVEAPVGDVEGNGLRRRGKRRQLMSTAPGLEVAPVVSISLQCGGGLGYGNVGLRLLNQFLDARHLRD